MIATETLVTEIPARAMLDLEPLGGEGFCAEYAVFSALAPATDGGFVLLAEHAGNPVALPIDADATVPVITYGVSNMLEEAS